MISKGNGEYHIIGLVEVIWKIIDTKIDQHMEDSIYLHDVLHSFRSQIRTGMNTLEVKTLQKIVGMRKYVLYEILRIPTRPMMHWNGGAPWRCCNGMGWAPRSSDS